MTKYLIAGLLAVLIAVSALAGLQYRRIGALQGDLAHGQATLRATQQELAAAQEHARLAEQVLLQREQRIRQLQRTAAQRQKDLDRVLQDNRGWADQPVPPDVSDWVRGRSSSAD
jgi:hypothetical protein